MVTAEARRSGPGTKRKKAGIFTIFQKQAALFFMTLPVVVYVLIFSYKPLLGLTMAFQNYRPGKAVQRWVGFKQFELLFTDEAFFRVLRNTLSMSIINLVLTFVFAILLALLINEIRTTRFKRLAQSVSYLPHFLSWIIVTGIIANFLSPETGIINGMLKSLGLTNEGVHWLGKPNLFWWIVGGSNVWKETGWNSIIFLAAITGISPELYEAAHMDGANRFHKMLYITLPGIRSTIVVLLILNMGWILNAGFEIQFLLGNNGFVYDVSETIDIFVLRNGVAQSNYSLATAAGLFKSVVSLIMLTLANTLAKRMGEERLV